jgi:hypothetical protein
MDQAKAGSLHQGDARAQREKQAQPRSMHDDFVEEIALGQGEIIAVEELGGEALVEQVAQQGEREEIDRQEEGRRLFAEGESPLVLRDERSS